MTRKIFLGGFLAAMIALALISSQMPELWTQPNQILFSGEGDGLKNAFTPAYYLRYDEGITFSGMNYPNKEIITFTDNQPIIAWTLKGIDRWLPIADYAFGIYNWLLILGILVGVVCLYRIFTLFRVPIVPAIWFALIICALSPQLDRIDGHYALAYVGFIPYTWLMLLLFEKTKKWKWLAGLGIGMAFQSLVHLYFLPITLLFVASYTLFKQLISARWAIDKKASHWKLFFITLITSVVIIILVKSLDPITDRPSQPYGVDVYTSSLQSIFLPNKGPLNDLFFEHKIRFEGEAYLGFLALPWLLFLAIISRKKWSHLLEKHLFLGSSLLAASLVFIYSAGWINDLGLKYLTKHVSAINQFRSLGRLAWVLYYVGLSTLFIALYHKWSEWKNDASKYYVSLLPLISLLFWTWEAGFYFHYHTGNLPHSNTLIESTEAQSLVHSLEENGRSPKDFQAVMALPSTYLGPEKIQSDRGVWFLQFIMPLAYQFHLPLMDIMMSRTSISQAMEFLELFTPPYVPKSKLSKMGNDPILCLYAHDDCTELEKAFARNKKRIARSDNFDWLSINPTDLYSPTLHQEVLNNATFQDSLLHFYDGFNERNSDHYAGLGAKMMKGKQQSLWKGRIPAHTIYTASFWVRIIEDQDQLPHIEFKKYGKEGNEVYSTNFDFRTETIAHKGWLKVVWRFDTSSEMDSFEILINSPEVMVDELIIHPSNITPYTRSGTDILYDNFLISE